LVLSLELALYRPSGNYNWEEALRLGKSVESWCERYSVYVTAPPPLYIGANSTPELEMGVYKNEGLKKSHAMAANQIKHSVSLQV